MDVKCTRMNQQPAKLAKKPEEALTQEMHSAPILSDSDIDFVHKLAERAGYRAIGMRDNVEVKEKSGPDDPVTSADVELSRIIVSALTQRFSNDQIISEEDAVHPACVESRRVWLIDPIDGTKNYISRNGQYSVMIGLLVDGIPSFGWVYEAEAQRMYYGGPDYGAFVASGGSNPKRLKSETDVDLKEKTRIIMGSRDRKKHPWVEELDSVEIVKTGSIGLKVARILEEKADILVHLSGKLKAWDTAGPAAIALGGKLEVGTLAGPGLDFPLPQLKHSSEVIMGRVGCTSWCKANLVKNSGSN